MVVVMFDSLDNPHPVRLLSAVERIAEVSASDATIPLSWQSCEREGVTRVVHHSGLDVCVTDDENAFVRMAEELALQHDICEESVAVEYRLLSTCYECVMGTADAHGSVDEESVELARQSVVATVERLHDRGVLHGDYAVDDVLAIAGLPARPTSNCNKD